LFNSGVFLDGIMLLNELGFRLTHFKESIRFCVPTPETSTVASHVTVDFGVSLSLSCACGRFCLRSSWSIRKCSSSFGLRIDQFKRRNWLIEFCHATAIRFIICARFVFQCCSMTSHCYIQLMISISVWKRRAS
jgi:hypothetical protein